eukprot:3499612-Amphidinium_carterae.1
MPSPYVISDPCRHLLGPVLHIGAGGCLVLEFKIYVAHAFHETVVRDIRHFFMSCTCRTNTSNNLGNLRTTGLVASAS